MTLSPDTAPSRPALSDVASRAPCLIIHSNVLVAEDLSDILKGEGATDVLTGTDLAQAPLSPVRIVFVSGSAQPILESQQAALWAEHGTPVVLLNSIGDPELARRAGFHVLEEPFRTEDVTALLGSLRIF